MQATVKNYESEINLIPKIQQEVFNVSILHRFTKKYKLKKLKNMKKITKIRSITMLACWCIGLQAIALNLDSKLLFTAKMTGAQETPSVTTNAMGVASFTLNKTRDTMCVIISVNGLSGAITGAHVHNGAFGVAGSVVTALPSTSTSNQIKTMLTGVDVSPANIQKYLNGLMYVNVHTTANPNGEIRGQIYLESDYSYIAKVNGVQETPAVITNAYALGVFNLAQHDSVLNFHVVAQGLSGIITGAHLHLGAMGVSGGVVISLNPYISGNVISGTISTGLGSILSNLKSGKIYLNIHTQANPNGEIRGQLLTDNSLYFDASMNGPQDGTTATGTGVVSMKLNTTFDTLFYNVVADGLTGSISGMHIHTGNLGNTGAVLATLNSSSTSNESIGFVFGSTLTPALITGLLNGSTYVNIHTAANPNGEIRGQIYRLARQGYNFEMSGIQQFPTPVITNAYGSGIISVDRNSTNAHYMVVVGGLSGPETGVHIHTGAPTQSGAVLYNLSSSFAGIGTNDAAWGYLKNTDATPFKVQTGASMYQDSTYINLHTNVNPNGEIRGNITAKASCLTSIPTGIKQNNISTSSVEIFPNPSSGIITINAHSTSLLNQITLVQIYNLVGQKVMEHQVVGATSCQLNISALNNGLYIVKISNGTEQITKQLIKN